MKILVIGGNRFFGRHIATECLRAGDQLTVLNRGNTPDNLVGRFQRMKVDRTDFAAMSTALKGKTWDIVYDQVCFDAKTAKEAVKLFRGNVGHYVYTSSISVYGEGMELKEGNFLSKDVVGDTPTTTNYGLAKLEAEGVFARELPNNSVSVRLGMVVGEDDYTGRLKWHIDHVLNKQPMKFADREAQLSFIHSKQAGEAIHFLGKLAAKGAVNCAAPDGVAINKFIQTLEVALKHKAMITMTGEESPYSIAQDLWVDTGKLTHLGFKIPPTKEWLATTIANLAQT